MNICKKFNLLAFLPVFSLCFFPASGNLDNFSAEKETIAMVDIQKNDDPRFFGMTEEEIAKVALAGSGTTIDYRGVIAADVDGDSREELLVDFGSIGIWLYDPDSTPKWVVLYGVNPDFMVDVDFDGDGRMEIFAYFDSQNAIHKWDWELGDPNGVWQWNYDVNHKCDYMFCAYIEDDGEEEFVLGLKATDSSWYKMYVDEYDSNNWERTIAYDGRTYAAWGVDFAGAPEDEIVAYRQSMYLWEWVPPDQYWLDNWTSMNGNSADYMVRADLDGDGDHELLVKFSTIAGLWKWDDDTTPKWQRINGADPDQLEGFPRTL